MRVPPLHARSTLARHLGAQGARICIVDMVTEKNVAAVAALEAKGIRAMSEVVNVADEEQWKAAVAKFEAAFGRIDVLVQCAGITGKTGARAAGSIAAAAAAAVAVAAIAAAAAATPAAAAAARAPRSPPSYLRAHQA